MSDSKTPDNKASEPTGDDLSNVNPEEQPKTVEPEIVEPETAEPPLPEEQAPLEPNSPPPAAEPPPPESKTSQTSAPEPRASSPSWVKLSLLAGFIALLVSVAVVGAAGYWGMQQQDQAKAEFQQIEQQTQQQQQLLTELRGSIEQQRQTLQKNAEALVADNRKQLQQQIQRQGQEQERLLQRLDERVNGHQQRLLSLSTTSREDWLLAEAVYLLKLANQRVLLERSSDNAVALLEAADKIVQEVAAGLGDAELFAVRKQLAKELAALKLVDNVDRDGIYLQLSAMADAIDQIPRVPEHELDSPKSDSEEQAQSPGDDSGYETKEGWLHRAWREVKHMAGKLNGYIRIEDSETPEKPLIDQYTTQVAGLNIRLLLEQAQVALLREQAVAYTNSLQQAQVVLDNYFIASSAASDFRNQLGQLKTITISPELPDISGSLRMLNGHLQNLHKLEPAAEGQL